MRQPMPPMSANTILADPAHGDRNVASAISQVSAVATNSSPSFVHANRSDDRADRIAATHSSAAAADSSARRICPPATTAGIEAGPSLFPAAGASDPAVAAVGPDGVQLGARTA